MVKLTITIAFVAAATVCNIAINAQADKDCTSLSSLRKKSQREALKTIEYCSEKYMSEVSRARSLVHADEELDDLTDGCYAENISSYDGKLASRVAELVRRKKGRVKSVSDLRKAYNSVTPCKAFIKGLNKSYLDFLVAAGNPPYYSMLGMQHMLFADMVAACNRIDTTDSIFMDAFKMI